VVVDVFEREIDLLGALVDVEDLADGDLTLADVIADVLIQPLATGDVDQSALVLVLLEIDEDAEVFDFVDLADDEFAGVGPAAVLHRDSTVSRISCSISALPPVGRTSVVPQTAQATSEEALPKTVCSFSQSLHRTL